MNRARFSVVSSVHRAALEHPCSLHMGCRNWAQTVEEGVCSPV